LDPQAIAAVITDASSTDQAQMSPVDIETWLQANKWDQRFFGRTVPEQQRSESYWLENVHGAKVLQCLFATFAETGLEYKKVEHGLALTGWLIDKAKENLAEVGAVIGDALKGPPEA
jgi:hypothetical protein